MDAHVTEPAARNALVGVLAVWFLLLTTGIGLLAGSGIRMKQRALTYASRTEFKNEDQPRSCPYGPAAAVGNSTFIERFYDLRFHNKLYECVLSLEADQLKMELDAMVWEALTGGIRAWPLEDYHVPPVVPVHTNRYETSPS